MHRARPLLVPVASQKLEIELQSVTATNERLERELRALEQAKRRSDMINAEHERERERVAGRLSSLPEALRLLQVRLNDTLINPLEETVRTLMHSTEQPPEVARVDQATD